jgi:hypothetical protein
VVKHMGVTFMRITDVQASVHLDEDVVNKF